MSESGATGSQSTAVMHYDYALFGAVETHPLDRLHQVMARRLAASWREVPHVTHFDAFDITDLEAQRKAQAGSGAAPPASLLACLVAAVSRTLGQHADFNASLDPDGKTLYRKQYRNIGIAVDTEAGLLVPVLRDVQDMDLMGIDHGIAALAGRARNGQLRSEDVEGGSFTVTSLGRLGGTGFAPIINAPEVAILGLACAQEQPVVRAGQVVVRRMLPLSLSYDHRVIDGAAAGRFMAALRDSLDDIVRENRM